MGTQLLWRSAWAGHCGDCVDESALIFALSSGYRLRKREKTAMVIGLM